MGIKYKTEFEIERDAPVSEQLRFKVDGALERARSVSVIRIYDGRKQDTRNGFALTTKAGNDRPEQSAREVAQAIANIMQHTCEQLHAEGNEEEVVEGVEFSIKMLRFGGGKSSTFKWVWQMRTDDDVPEDEVEDATFANPDLIEGSHQYLHAHIQELHKTIERARFGEEHANRRLLLITERMRQPMEHQAQHIQFAHGVLTQGLQATLNAAQLTFGHEQAKLLEESKSKRWDKALGTFAEVIGPAAKIGLQQVVMYLGNKATGNNARVPRAAEFKDGQAPTPSRPPGTPTEGQPANAGSDAQTAAAADEPVSTPTPEDPIYEIVAAFDESLRAQHRRKLRSSFDPEQLDAFDDLLEANDGEQVKERYAALLKTLGGDYAPLMSVLENFDESQQQLVFALIGMMSEEE